MATIFHLYLPRETLKVVVGQRLAGRETSSDSVVRKVTREPCGGGGHPSIKIEFEGFPNTVTYTGVPFSIEETS